MRRSRYCTLVETMSDGTEIWVSAQKEDISPEEEGRSLGDAAWGRSFARAARNMLRRWGRWGWCTIMVTAVRAGEEGLAYVGCCSYESAEDFKASYGNWTYMVNEALQELNEALTWVPV